MRSTRRAIQAKPTMMPAMAIPSPFCVPLDCLIWERAMKPKMMPSTAGMKKRNPAMPQTNAATARPFVLGDVPWPYGA